MTYCVGLLLDAGVVLLSDTRTNAGLDNIATYRKMFLFEQPGDRAIGIMTAGSLSITQTVMARLADANEEPDNDRSILRAPTMLQVAELVGATLSDVTSDVKSKMERMSQNATASMIVAGQRKGGPMRMFLIYPEGNFIEASDDNPFFQIGETKYGKPILVRAYDRTASFEKAIKLLLVSFDSTIKSNLSVGLPIDYVTYSGETLRFGEQGRILDSDPYYQEVSNGWSEALKSAFAQLPDFTFPA